MVIEVGDPKEWPQAEKAMKEDGSTPVRGKGRKLGPSPSSATNVFTFTSITRVILIGQLLLMFLQP